MLVLTRHKEEQIVVGDDIVITVVDIRGDKVRIGIDAPASLKIMRTEVLERIRTKEENNERDGD